MVTFEINITYFIQNYKTMIFFFNDNLNKVIILWTTYEFNINVLKSRIYSFNNFFIVYIIRLYYKK